MENKLSWYVDLPLSSSTVTIFAIRHFQSRITKKKIKYKATRKYQNLGDTESKKLLDLARMFGKGNNFNSNCDNNTNMANSALISPPPTDVDRTSLAHTETRHKICSRLCLVEMGWPLCETINWSFCSPLGLCTRAWIIPLCYTIHVG